MNKPRIHQKADGLLLVHNDGKARYLTFWEAVKYYLFRAIPKDDYPRTKVIEPAYVIRKNGYFYRPNACGYTDDIMEAGLFHLDEAIHLTHPNGRNGPRDGLTYHHRQEFPATKKINCQSLEIAALKAALRELEQTEAAYRLTHDLCGAGDIKTGRAWDRMRRAGDRARALLQKPVNENQCTLDEKLLAECVKTLRYYLSDSHKDLIQRIEKQLKPFYKAQEKKS